MNKVFTKEDLQHVSKTYRLHLINSLSGFKSANLIGTKDKLNQENLCIVSSTVHVGSNPPALGVIFRPHSVPRHSLENILNTSYYTINHVSNQFIKQAHQTSAKYPKDVSEFEATGLTPYYDDRFFAPFVKESEVKIGLKFVEKCDISFNPTHFIIGEVIFISIDDRYIEPSGKLNFSELNTVCLSGLDRYYGTQFIEEHPQAAV